MDLKTFELDLTFKARAGIGPIGELIIAVGDMLVGIKVTGPLYDPKVELIPLPGLSEPDSPSSRGLSVVDTSKSDGP